MPYSPARLGRRLLRRPFRPASRTTSSSKPSSWPWPPRWDSSGQELKIQVAELEQKLKKADDNLRAAQAGTRYWETEYRALASKQMLFTIIQNILNAGVAWYRAKESRNGKTEEKLEALKKAVTHYCEVEGKVKKAS
jgi:hypothetical protein